MADVTLYFKNGQSHSKEDVRLEESLTTLTVHDGPGSRSVIPLSALQYYDVEESE